MSIRYDLAGSVDSLSGSSTLRISGASKANASIRIVQGLPAFTDCIACVKNRPYLEPALEKIFCFSLFMSH
jgi:hypothetical protein